MLTVSILFLLSLSSLETSEILFTHKQKSAQLFLWNSVFTRTSYHANTTWFTAFDECPQSSLRARVRGGGSPALSSEQAPRTSFVVNLLTPAERILRKKLEEESLLHRTNAAAAIPDSDRTQMYKEGVRKLARYDFEPLNTSS
jgi:hypothetical protein